MGRWHLPSSVVKMLSRTWQKVWVLASNYNSWRTPFLPDPSDCSVGNPVRIQVTIQKGRWLPLSLAECPACKGSPLSSGGPGSVKMAPFLLGSMDQMGGLFASLKYLVCEVFSGVLVMVALVTAIKRMHLEEKQPSEGTSCEPSSREWDFTGQSLLSNIFSDPRLRQVLVSTSAAPMC